MEKIRNLIKSSGRLHTLLTEIKQLQAGTVMAIFEIGKRYKEIHDKKLWKTLDYVHSFREFCEKEAKVSHTTVYNCINIYEKFGHFVGKRQIDCDITRLVKALPYVTEDNAEDWLVKAEMLTKGDYEDYIREAQGKKPKIECLHEEVESWDRCKICGAWINKQTKGGQDDAENCL